MTTLTAPLATITLQALLPDVVRSCVVQQPAPPPNPGETPPPPIDGPGIYTPVPPGITLPSLPPVTIIDTSPDQMIGCIISTGTNPQGRLNALFPAAIDGDGVIERNTNDIWVYDGALWENVGPNPGPTIVNPPIIPPWNEIVNLDGTVRAKLVVQSLPYALEQLTTVPAIGTILGLAVQTSQALVRVPAVDQSLAVQLPAVSSGGSVLPPVAAITLAAPIPQVSSGASVAVPLTLLSFAASDVPYVGTGATVVQAAKASASLMTFPPTVASGASVDAPAANTTFAVTTALIYAYDTDALAYITAVENTDNQELEYAIRVAINDFVVGCKSDGIWNAIKASCILAGARTRLGAMNPLKGSAPTNVNFVDDDYSRTTGLKGDASSKYLDTNRAGNADPQNNNHNSVYITTAHANAAGGRIISNGGAETGTNSLVVSNGASTNAVRNRSSASQAVTGNTTAVGLFGATRSGSSTVTVRVNQATSGYSLTSETPRSTNITVFAGIGAATVYSDARVSFYSIGEDLDLALLDARVTQLMDDIDAAI